MAETMTADQAVFLLQNVYLGPLKIESRTTKKRNKEGAPFLAAWNRNFSWRFSASKSLFVLNSEREAESATWNGICSLRLAIVDLLSTSRGGSI